MARREGQGLQILVIIFVFLTMILAFLSYYFIANYRTSEELLVQKKAELEAERKLRQTYRKATECVLYMNGLPPLAGDEETYKSYMAELTTGNVDATVQDLMKGVEKEFNADMEPLELSQNQAEGINWRTEAAFLWSIVSEKNKTIEMREATNKETLAKQLSDKASYDADIRKYQNEVEKYIADYNQIKENAEKKEAELQETNNEWERKHDIVEKDMKKQQVEKDAQIAALKPMIKERDKLIARLREEIRSLQPTDFDVADGKVTLTNAATKTVWVNKGSKDNLRPQISFAIYGQGVTKFLPENKKGDIQIQQIVGPHLATARIVHETLRDPILAGDSIHTPAWSPSRRVKFVIAGDFDLDGDGINDQSRFKTILAANNGEVIAELSASGEVIGELSEVGPTARYFVQGDVPKQGNMKAKYAKYLREAEIQKIEKINYRDLLEKMGVHDEVRTAKPGQDSGSRFKPRRGPGGAY